MHRLIHRLHLWLGLFVSLPVLAWASSGLLYALPNTVEGGTIERIAPERVKITPADAMQRANQLTGRNLPTTALTLLMRDGRPVYQAVGGLGADSVLIDAETGAARMAPPPGALTRYFRQAHFYFFAGAWQVTLLVVFSALACLSAATGIYLNARWWLRK
jgi:uncharacterized iron-regulated membrane protein